MDIKMIVGANNTICSEADTNFIGTYVINNDVLIITWPNNIKHFYIKNSDNVFSFYLFDNFDLDYYKTQINNDEIVEWIDGMEHWLVNGRLKNIPYNEKIVININNEMTDIYLNHSHKHIIDVKNNKKYLFINTMENILEINFNSFVIENEKIIFENDIDDIKNYIKTNDFYTEYELFLKNIGDIIKNNEKVIVFYSKHSMKGSYQHLPHFLKPSGDRKGLH